MFQGKIINLRAPKDDVTRSVHVWLEAGDKKHDLVIYDHSDFMNALRMRGLAMPAWVYDTLTYNHLCSQATEGLHKQVSIKARNNVIQEIKIG